LAKVVIERVIGGVFGKYRPLKQLT
jgi:hypothetical protein